MQHRQRNKPQCMRSQRQGIAVFDNLKIKFAAEILDSFTTSLLRNDHFGLRRRFHDERQSAAMIGFDVIDNDIVDFFRIDNFLDPLQQLFRERRFHRINQANLFIHDEIGVIGNPAWRFIAMKIAVSPVHRPHLIYSFGKLCVNHRHQFFLLLSSIIG